MSRQAPFPVPAWDLMDELDLEEAKEELAEAEADAAAANEADVVYMANVEVFLVRDDRNRFLLTLKHKGVPTEIRLSAIADEDGAPTLIAELAPGAI